LGSTTLYAVSAQKLRGRICGIIWYRDNSSSTRQISEVYRLFQMDEAGLEKEKPSLKNVISDGAIAVIAGADTAASALSSLFFFLLSHPKYYEQLQQEVDYHFPPGADPLDTRSHAEMKFLNACM
jgi:hypothetical protein